jgi:CBS domain-containing protein
MLCLRDIMTSELEKLTPETTIREAMEMFTSNHLSGAPVLAGDRVVGVVSMTDLLSFILTGPSKAGDSEEAATDRMDISEDIDEDDEEMESALASEDAWDEWTIGTEARIDEATPTGDALLDQCTVEEVMNTDIFALKPDATVRQAAKLMGEKGIHRVLVMKGKTLLGIVSAFDIARAVSLKGTANGEALKLHIREGKASPWISNDITP